MTDIDLTCGFPLYSSKLERGLAGVIRGLDPGALDSLCEHVWLIINPGYPIASLLLFNKLHFHLNCGLISNVVLHFSAHCLPVVESDLIKPL